MNTSSEALREVVLKAFDTPGLIDYIPDSSPEINELKRRIEALQEEIEMFEGTVSDLENTVSNLESEAEDDERRIEELEATNAEQLVKLGDAQDLVKQWETWGAT